MRNTKLILFPLIFLIVFAFLSQLGVADPSSWNSTVSFDAYSDQGFFDENAHQVAYLNGTATGEAGTKDYYFSGIAEAMYHTDMHWENTTGSYPIYNTVNGENQGEGYISMNIGSALGVIALIIGIMALAVVAGLRVLGSGVSETSVSIILKGTAFLTLWGIFSVLSISMITSAGLLAPFFYMFLTILYCIGVIGQVNGSGN